MEVSRNQNRHYFPLPLPFFSAAVEIIECFHFKVSGELRRPATVIFTPVGYHSTLPSHSSALLMVI